MKVSDAIKKRFSARAFTNEVISKETLAEILESAKYAPSGVNSQPWKAYVIQNEKLKILSEDACNNIDSGKTEEKEYLIYPKERPDWYKERQREVGYKLYESVGIKKDDINARIEQVKQNFKFFNASSAIFITVKKCVGPNGWGHVGHFIQNICLLALERNLATCLQEAWAEYPETVKKHIHYPEDEILWCGISIGHVDKDHPVNKFRTSRVNFDEFAKFID